MVRIVSASRNTVPPVFIFPRARFHDIFMNGAPPGSLGLVNSPSSGNAFSDEDFDASSVTDRPNVDLSVSEQPSCSSALLKIHGTQTNNVTHMPSMVSRTAVRPYPKAPPRSENSRRSRSKILTETTDKEELEPQGIQKQKIIKVTKKVFAETSSESECSSIHDDSDGPLSEGNENKESDD
ncbi:hypothetical protein RN001_008318 [Aquatica leii]|uniref:Uncharacterized protein n=1 Tax=Aquatica leii TaxID=1421715 RepID=A0AAN7SGK5_9COLE|nr:hypothetical protein RN001_008318 [Aquatica leii]